jgi:DNA-binding TFAR19-related protein (PDSD5 family)
MGSKVEEPGVAEITLDDVIAAIKVLRKFIELQRQAQRMLAAIAPQTLSDPRYAILERMLLQQQRAQREEVEDILEEELTPEERERLRRVAASLK